MWTLHTANAEHWVPIKTVASFKRMREFQALGNDWLVDALKKSEQLEVDAAGENLRRKTEVQPPKGQMERSVYAVRVPLKFPPLRGPSLNRSRPIGLAERLWEGGARAPEKAGRVLQPVRQDERGAHAEDGRHEGVQGPSARLVSRSRARRT